MWYASLPAYCALCEQTASKHFLTLGLVGAMPQNSASSNSRKSAIDPVTLELPGPLPRATWPWMENVRT